jgi:diketogulonate reductase-like aldo/keto reductase
MSTHLTSTASVAATESGDDAHTSPYAPLRTVTLNSGYSIPIIAYGTGTAQAWTDTSVPVATALKSGLVHLDTAWHYKNHTSTAEGIKRSGLTREQVFVTTKGGSFDDAPEEGDVRRWLEASLKDVSGGRIPRPVHASELRSRRLPH